MTLLAIHKCSWLHSCETTSSSDVCDMVLVSTAESAGGHTATASHVGFFSTQDVLLWIIQKQ
jgi:hypothetical protein